MDFSKLEIVGNANPRNVLNSLYDIKILNRETAHFQITEYAFDKYGFGNKGAVQINGDGEAFIGVIDNTKAVFLKKSKKGTQKQRKFKNVKLMMKINDLGFTDDLLCMEYVEKWNDIEVYKLTEGIRDATATATATEETPLVAEPIEVEAEEDPTNLPEPDDSPDELPQQGEESGYDPFDDDSII